VIYQEKNQLPSIIDFQLAISRISLNHKTTALEKANRTLKGNYLALIQFLLNPTTNFPAHFNAIDEEDKSAISSFYYPFITAAITKNGNGYLKEKISIPKLKIAILIFYINISPEQMKVSARMSMMCNVY